jgi:hypothetical protein
VKILKKNKINNLFKINILAFILIFTSFASITISSSPVSSYEKVANYVVEQLKIDKDEVLIYVWEPVNKGEEIFAIKEHIMDAPDKGFIIYIDPYPRANLFHPVKYIFLSENKEQFIVKDAMSPPKNFEDYQIIKTAIGEQLYSVQNRRAPIPKEKISMTISSDSRWAVLMNGGYGSGSNHVRYWNDLSNIYIALVYVYGYPDENIIVLCSDGLDPAPDQSNGLNSDPDLDGDGDDDIMYSCVLENVDAVFEELADILTEGNELFIFQTDHGDTNGGWDTIFNLWNAEELTDAHFAELLEALPECEIVCTFEPCFSGGFLDDVVVPPGPIIASSACRHDEYSWAMENLEYDEYAFHWTAAVKGEDAYGVPVYADYNEDGKISMDEAFVYAEEHDVQSESPQYGDYPEDIGKEITLWPSSKPPEIPTKPDGPEQWFLNVECTFTSTTTEPEGEDMFYMFDWGDGNFSDWIGPYASGETGEAEYSWADLGEYEIKAVAKDINGVESEWSEPSSLLIVENAKPEHPDIDGKHIGFGGVEYEFTFVSTDPDGHDVYYRIDWDDDIKTDWLGPYSSNEIITLNHSWKKKGEYWIKAWAKDIYDGTSGQGMYKITILTNKAKSTPAYRNLLIFKFLKNLINRFPMISYLLNGLK